VRFFNSFEGAAEVPTRVEEEGVASLELSEIGSDRTWKLAFSRSVLRVSSDGLDDLVVDRADRFDGVVVVGTALTIARPKRLHLLSNPLAARALRSWQGPPTMHYLRQRMRKLFVEGVLGGAFVVVIGLVLGESGGTISFGIPLVVAGVAAKVLIHRGVFLIMAAIYLGNSLLSAFAGFSHGSKWLFLVAVFFAISALLRVRDFRRFEYVVLGDG